MVLKYWRHLLVVLEFFCILLLLEVLAGGVRLVDNPWQRINPVEIYGKWPTIFIYCLRGMVLITVPFAVCNFIGILFYNTYPERPKLKGSPLLGPFVCFRVVTRGDCPELVRDNVERNIRTCEKVGLDKYLIEVVTDKSICIDEHMLSRAREVVVPTDYKCKRGALYKARALNFCLEDGVNILNDDDWIVHLDEETLLTETSLIGILNFIKDGGYQLGQGNITYANEDVVNWFTTLADCARVATDFGMLRMSFNIFNKPVFCWKGSFVVVNLGVEKKLTFDHGVEGSIAEDSFFAMKGYAEGYSFGWIEGEMWEKSTFTMMDYVKQRKRWLQGLILAWKSRNIPWRCKAGLTFMVASGSTLPLTINNIFIPIFLPVPTWQIFDVICGFQGAVFFFLYIFGAQKSFSFSRLGLRKFIFMIALAVLNLPVVLAMEFVSSVWAVVGKKAGFYVVQKETKVSTSKRRANVQLV